MAAASKNEIWVLLAKYWCDEAAPEECLQVEALLSQDRDLREYFQKLQTISLLKEYRTSKDGSKSFSKLDKKIKSYAR